MAVVKKVQAATESYVVGASGRVSAIYAAFVDGEEVARFRPAGRSGYGSSSARCSDVSGRRLVGRDVLSLKDFRAWAANDFEGAFVLRPKGLAK